MNWHCTKIAQTHRGGLLPHLGSACGPFVLKDGSWPVSGQRQDSVMSLCCWAQTALADIAPQGALAHCRCQAGWTCWYDYWRVLQAFKLSIWFCWALFPPLRLCLFLADLLTESIHCANDTYMVTWEGEIIEETNVKNMPGTYFFLNIKKKETRNIVYLKKKKASKIFLYILTSFSCSYYICKSWEFWRKK